MLRIARLIVCLLLANAAFASAMSPGSLSTPSRRRHSISASESPVIHACVRRRREREETRHHFVQHPHSALLRVAPMSPLGLAFQPMDGGGQRPGASSSAPPDHPPA